MSSPTFGLAPNSPSISVSKSPPIANNLRAPNSPLFSPNSPSVVSEPETVSRARRTWDDLSRAQKMAAVLGLLFGLAGAIAAIVLMFKRAKPEEPEPCPACVCPPCEVKGEEAPPPPPPPGVKDPTNEPPPPPETQPGGTPPPPPPVA